jgi:uncharacterized protein
MGKKILMVLTAVLSVSATADLSSMAARVHQLVPLKEKGLVGEKRDGMVGVVKDGENAAEVVAAENRDRLEIYQARAREGGVALPAFMKIMGEERQKKEPGGRMIQNESGNWIRK